MIVITEINLRESDAENNIKNSIYRRNISCIIFLEKRPCLHKFYLPTPRELDEYVSEHREGNSQPDGHRVNNDGEAGEKQHVSVTRKSTVSFD